MYSTHHKQSLKPSLCLTITVDDSLGLISKMAYLFLLILSCTFIEPFKLIFLANTNKIFLSTKFLTSLTK